MQTMTEQPPASWHVDPFGRHERRYWDGSQWTQHVDTSGRQGIDPPVHAPAVPRAIAVRPVAGWYPDPFGGGGRRYWDGGQWTGHVDAVQHGGGTLFTEQVLVIKQDARVVRSSLEYAIYNQRGQQLGSVEEVRRKFRTKRRDKSRGRSDATRTRRFRVVDMNGRVMLEMIRPELWLSSKGNLVVEAPGGPIGQIVYGSHGFGEAVKGIFRGSKGRPAGSAHGRLGYARFALEAGGQTVGSIHARDTSKWDFNVLDIHGAEVAQITKTWAGWAKERFTKADNYEMKMHRPLEEPLRSLVIAASLAIDIQLKERGDQTRGSSLWGTRSYK
jgi:uncharacterized protein YxjI